MYIKKVRKNNACKKLMRSKRGVAQPPDAFTANQRSTPTLHKRSDRETFTSYKQLLFGVQDINSHQSDASKQSHTAKHTCQIVQQTRAGVLNWRVDIVRKRVVRLRTMFCWWRFYPEQEAKILIKNLLSALAWGLRSR